MEAVLADPASDTRSLRHLKGHADETVAALANVAS